MHANPSVSAYIERGQSSTPQSQTLALLSAWSRWITWGLVLVPLFRQTYKMWPQHQRINIVLVLHYAYNML